MKVLWFADAQLPAVTGLPRTGGGWLEGLRAALERFQPDIELGIASPGVVHHDPFIAGNTTYFHLDSPDPETRITRVVRRWRHDPVPRGTIARCADIVRAFHPDVVHIHGTEHYFGLAIPYLQVPVVASLQGMATVCQRYMLTPMGITDLMRDIPTREFLVGLGALHTDWAMRSRAQVEESIVAACDDFMGRTDWDREVLRLLRPRARYHQVGEVLGEPFYRARWEEPACSVGQTLYCTAGDSPLKGVEILLEALTLLRRSGLRSPRLRLAGRIGEGPMARKIHGLLGAPELCGAVDVLGTCTPVQIAEELSKASLFVLPSHIENSPNALCEAMVVGTPCIAAFVGGVPSLIHDGVDGLLYHDTDPYALAGKIDALLGDPGRAAKLGARGREKALRRHDPKTVAGQAAAAYLDVQGRPRHGVS